MDQYEHITLYPHPAGFWWCGRYGMHRWDMPIVPITVDLARFSHVTASAGRDAVSGDRLSHNRAGAAKLRRPLCFTPCSLPA